MSTTSRNQLDFSFDAHCKTDVMESEKFTFVWEILKFSSRNEANGVFILSKQFTIEGPGDKLTKWRVKIYPNGRDADCSNYASVFLLNEGDEDEIVNCSLLTVDFDKKKIKFPHQHNQHDFVMKMQKIEPKKSCGWTRFFDRTNQMTQFAPNDTLTLVFEVRVMGEVEESIELDRWCSNKSETLLKNFHQDQMSQDLGFLYSNKDLSDVIIICGNKKFECHKSILSSRSPVFKAMFTSNMKEQNAGSVEIKNMNPEVLENLLQYIYTCEASNIDKLTKELIAAADQYQIEKLKELCEVKLCHNMTVENCIELLGLGDIYQAPTLKARALWFVSQNMEKINISECRKNLISNPTLLFEVIEMIFPKNDDKSVTSKEKKRAAIS